MRDLQVESPTYPGWVIRIMGNLLAYLEQGWEIEVTVDTKTGEWSPERWIPYPKSDKTRKPLNTTLVTATLESTGEFAGRYPESVHWIGEQLVDLKQRGSSDKAIINIANGKITGYRRFMPPQNGHSQVKEPVNCARGRAHAVRPIFRETTSLPESSI